MPLNEEHSSTQPIAPVRLGAFRMLGVPVRPHFTFILLLAFLIVAGLGSEQSPLYCAIDIIALVASVLAHELAHGFISRHFGLKTLELVVFPFGGLSRLDRRPVGLQEFWIALAGPLVNLLIGFGILGVLAARHGLTDFAALAEPNDTNVLGRMAAGNLILGVLNLMPAFPMDGGRIIRSILARFFPQTEATRMATWAGRSLAIALGVCGVLVANYALVFMAFFVYLGAAQEGAAAMGRHLTLGIPVRAAMLTEYRTLSHGNTVRDAANLSIATAQQAFPVVHGDQVIGLLGRKALMRAMARKGPDTYVAGVMDREYPTFSPDMDLSDVLPIMAQTGACALVMQGERLLGVLTSENLSQYVLFRRFGMEAARIEAGV